MLARLVVLALLALTFTSWHWSPTHLSATQGSAVTVTDDDGGVWTWLAAPGVVQALPAIFSLFVLLVAPVAGLRPSHRSFVPRPRAPPSG